MTKTKKRKKSSDAEACNKELSSAKELKKFLLNIRDKMTDGSAPAINALSAMNYLLCQSEIYTVLNEENKEIARDIWLRLRQAGLQVKNPPLLFTPDEENLVTAV
ncbi:MAG: hypothetical protein R3A13_01005 [Bdellovibrionota bacterium]